MRSFVGLLLSALTLAAGCSSTSSGTTQATDGGSSGSSGSTGDGASPGDAAPADAGPAGTFTQIYTDIISKKCVGCHTTLAGSGVTDGHLDMTSQDNAYKNLVNTPAAGLACGGMGTRVTPGHSDTSILFNKINPGTAAPCGSKMPLFGTPLLAEEAALIAGWINAGAKND
jgi:hypothetical protein